MASNTDAKDTGDAAREKPPAGRRNFLLGSLSAGIAASATGVTAGQTNKSLAEQHPATCRAAFDRLTNGNKRFVSGELRHPHLGTGWRRRLEAGQKPFATILGCSDSRVPPELLFDQGFGDLFVIRVAGNVIDTDVTGSVEYGVDHLKTRLVLVMGHDGCGAVTAALQKEADLQEEPNEIRSLIGKIKPGIRDVAQQPTFADQLRLSVEANVRASVKQLSQVPDLAKAERNDQTRIVGCVYDIHTGSVRILDR